VSEVRHVGSQDGLRRLDADALPKAPPGDAQSDDESDQNGSRYAHDRAPFLLPPYEPTYETTRCGVRFVTDPTWRAYVITYSAGRDLCRAYVDGDPGRLRTLLTEHVRVGDLLAAASKTNAAR